MQQKSASGTLRSRTYTPKETKQAEERIRSIAWATMQQERIKPLTGSVGVEMTFYVPRMNVDIDNLQKTVLDGLNKVAFEDDRQIVECRATKRHDTETPRTIVSVWEIENENNCGQ